LCEIESTTWAGFIYSEGILIDLADFYTILMQQWVHGFTFMIDWDIELVNTGIKIVDPSLWHYDVV